jgi:hypothetical protein
VGDDEKIIPQYQAESVIISKYTTQAGTFLRLDNKNKQNHSL